MCLIGGCFCEQGLGVSGHRIPRTAAMCHLHLARYFHLTTNALSPWDSLWLGRLNEAERVVHPELRTVRMFMRSTVGIVSLVTPKDGMNGREIRGVLLGPTQYPIRCVPGRFCLFIQLRTAALRLIVRSCLDVSTFATRRLHACHHARAPSGGR